MRQAEVSRKTAETDVQAVINLDGCGEYDINTGCGFLDHMLAQLSRHGLIDIKIKAVGDLHVDAHHLVEDVGITLGQAFTKALNDKKGINRYGAACIPMDEALSRCVLDLSGRSYLVWNVKLPTEKIGNVDSEVFREFFTAFAQHAAATVHIENLYGVNSHHVIESVFKAFARALKNAVEKDPRSAGRLPSTKESL